MSTQRSRHLKADYRLDGGNSRAVSEALEPLLDEVRARLAAKVAIALYRPHGPARETRVLVATGQDDGHDLPLPNEPVRLNVSLASRGPSMRQDVSIESTVRAFRIELAEAVLVPWRDGKGGGALLVGLTPSSYGHGVSDLESAGAFGSRLRDAHSVAALTGTVRLQGDVTNAVRLVAEATVDEADPSSVLAAIATAARMLLGTAATYISLPDNDPDYFEFHALVNIKTSAFRRLRVRHGEGLGGLAREHLRTIRSINYAEDPQLRHAPVRETLGEGILSAMCTPLVAEGNVLGLLYAANRKLTPFSDTDVSLIEEFARHAALRMRWAQLERHRQTVIRQREQERLAALLHDSVVRQLMEIGFQAEKGMGAHGDSALQNRFSLIAQAAESCLETLRDHLAELTSHSRDEDSRLQDLLDAVRMHDWGTYGSATIEWECTTPAVRVSHPVAEAITRVAREAVENANIHAHCRTIRVSLTACGREVRLSVADDGRGMTRDEIAHALSEEVRHFGLRGMRAAAKQAGGHLSLSVARHGGLVVEAHLPVGDRNSRATT